MNIVDRGNLRKALESFNIGRITRLRQLRTTGNETYIVSTSMGTFILRISPLDANRGRSRNELLAEVEFTNLLFEKNVPLSPYIKDRNNNYLVFIGDRYGLIRRYDSGKSRRRTREEHVANFARLLGKIHKVSEGYQTEHKRTHVWGPEVTCQHAKDCKETLMSVSKEFDYHNRIFTLLKKTLPEKLPKGMIHEDLGKRHILWDKDNITSIIDFDRCYYGYLSYDLGQAIRGWCYSENGKVNPHHLKVFIENYQRARKLTDPEKASLNQAVAFAFAERSLSFALRSVMQQEERYAEYSINQLEAGEAVIAGSPFGRPTL